MSDIPLYFLLFVIVVAFFEISGKRAAMKRAIKEAQTFTPEASFDSARWANEKDLKQAGVFKKDGIYMGLSPDGKPMYMNRPGHMLIVVGSRMGKLYTLIVSLICRLGRNYSLVMLDPKLEMTPIIARVRASVGKVYVWNPYNVWPDHLKGFPPASWNGMLDIDTGLECYSECDKFIGTFYDDKTKASDPHWLTAARDATVATTYTLVKYGRPEEKNLPAVKRIISGTNAPFFEFARYACALGDPIINQALSDFARKGAEKDRELRSILKSAKTQFAWLDPMIAESLKRTDFSMMDLKTTKGMTVASGLPLHQQGDGKAMALFTGWMLHCCLKQGSKGHGGKVVAVVDEMANLGAGPSKQWLDAFANGAGAGGISIVGVYQDLNQIAVQMGREAVGTILQNCEATLYWGVADGETRKKVSELAGTREVISESKSVNWRGGDPSVSGTKTVRTVPLIQPHEVGAVGGDKRDTRMISFVRGLPPIMGRRKPYTQVEAGYGKNPFYKGGWFGG